MDDSARSSLVSQRSTKKTLRSAVFMLRAQAQAPETKEIEPIVPKIEEKSKDDAEPKESKDEPSTDKTEVIGKLNYLKVRMNYKDY